jgi:sigma-B regulation protein RsbU (phosphoserine phosphatase)
VRGGFLGAKYAFPAVGRDVQRRLPKGVGDLKPFNAFSRTVCLSIRGRDRLLGLVVLGGSGVPERLPSEMKVYLDSLIGIAAATLEKLLALEELRLANRRLDAKIQEQNTLFELSKEFSQVLDFERLLRLFSFAIMGQVGVNRYLVCLDRNGAIEIAASRLDSLVDAALLSQCHELKEPMRVADIGEKRMQPFRNTLARAGIVVLVPMQVHNEVRGALGVGKKMNGEPYTESDLEFLYSLGSLAMVSLENARLFREAIEKQKLEDELLIAREIQRGLLPAKLPRLKDFSFAATNISSRQVGGDYYDVIPISEHEFVVVIADVSGKGTPASLLMANLQAAIRALAPLKIPLGELTRRVNDLICENTSPDRFITFFWGILDSRSRDLTYVNAGHNPPFLFRGVRVHQRLRSGGMILGVMRSDEGYEEGHVALHPGDLLVCFTDGISEAMNKDGKEFKESRLQSVIGSLGEAPAHSVVRGIRDAIKKHVADAPQSDDITLLVMKCHSHES